MVNIDHWVNIVFRHVKPVRSNTEFVNMQVLLLHAETSKPSWINGSFILQ